MKPRNLTIGAISIIGYTILLFSVFWVIDGMIDIFFQQISLVEQLQLKVFANQDNIATLEKEIIDLKQKLSVMQHQKSKSKVSEEGTINQLEKDTIMSDVISCESGGKHDGLWGDAGEYGLLQFKQETFYWLSNRMGFDGADWMDKDDQIKVFQYALRTGFGKWWTCYRNLRKS